MVLHMRQAGFIPINEAFSLRGEEVATSELRQQAGRLLPGVVNQYLFFWNRILVLPGLVLLALGAYRSQRGLAWLLRAGTSFLASILHGTFTLEKSFGMVPFIAVAAFLFFFSEYRTRLRYLLLGTLAAFVFPILVFWWILPAGSEWLEIAFAVGRRIFYVPAQGTYLHFELVPQQMGFFYGATSPIVAFLTGQRFFDVANYLFLQEFTGNIETGTANVCFGGMAWVNFGWVGVILEGLLAGAIVQLLYRLVRDREDIFSKALLALLVVPFTVGFTSVALETILLSYGVILAVLGWILLTHYVLKEKATG
jgi:hypothetical protein